MKLERSTTYTLLMALFFSPAIALSQDIGASGKKRDPQTALAAVPADAWAVLFVPSLAELDKKIVSFSQQLQLPMMGPPLGMAKMMLGLMAGVNDNGGLAIAFLPTENFGTGGRAIVIFVPTTGFDELVAPMSPEPVDDGISKILFVEKEAFAAPFGKFTIVGQTPGAVSKVLESKKSLRDTLPEVRMKRLKKDDVTLWVNLGAFTKTDMFASYVPMLQMINIDAGIIRQFDTAALSVRIDPAGLNIGGYVDADPKSDWGKAIASDRGTDESLLVGLPDEPFIVAAGASVSADAVELSTTMMDKTFATLAEQAGEQKELVEGVLKIYASVLGELRHVALSVTTLPAETGGMIGLSAVITSDGATKRIMDAVAKVVGTIKESLADDAEAAEYTKLVQHSPAAEKVADRPIDHLKITLPFEPGSKEMTLATKIGGPDGILFRIANVDENRVAIAFGGGTARLAKIIEAVKSNSAPLAKSKGVQAVINHLPKTRVQEGYFAVDRAVKLASAIGDAAGEPIAIPGGNIPDIHAPIALVQSLVAPAGSQTEVFLPIPLLQAAKDIAMAQAMAPPPPPPGQPAPPTDPEAKDREESKHH